MGSVQLAVIRYKEYRTLIDVDRPCSTADDVTQGRAKSPGTPLMPKGAGKMPQDENVAYMYTVPVHAATDTSSTSKQMSSEATTIYSAGVYVLVLANCGDLADVTVTGHVVVRNPYGYLPGTDYQKLPLY